MRSNYTMIKESRSTSPTEETDVYIHSMVRDALQGKLIETAGKATTLYEALNLAAESYGELNFLGYITGEETIEYLTYQEVREYAEEMAAFLVQHITTSSNPVIGICAENRPEWVIAEHATYFFDGINCPIYASFGWSATKHILSETEMQIVFVSKKNLDKIAAGIEKEVDTQIVLPEMFILMDSDISKTTEEIIKSHNIRIEYFWDILAKCQEVQPAAQKTTSDKPPTKPKTKPVRGQTKPDTTAQNQARRKQFKKPTPDSLATICYTSGTTGAPKGAMLTHRNFISVAGSFLLLSQNNVLFDIEEGNRYLSFLPLAHVFERIVETSLLLSRCSIVYYRGIPKELQKDFALVKPHYFVGVPRVFNSVKAAIEARAQEKGRVANAIFNASLKVCRYFKNRYVREIFGLSVFRAIRQTFGGSITCMLSGSAPLSIETAEFFEAVFNCKLFEGYGQTETAAGNITTTVSTKEKGVLGIPFLCNRVKLISRPESNALATNNQGEILMQGPSVFIGYYKQPGLTNEVFLSSDSKDSFNHDGTKWVKTGDIGEITAEGNLRIIGRSKEIFKLSQGEYIVPEKIENRIMDRKIYGLEDITITGDSSKDFVVAICVIKESSKVNSDNVQQSIISEGEKLVLGGELIKIEVPKKFVFTTTPFTIEDGLLTPSGKKIRKKITTEFHQEILKAYGSA
ncbi:long-chain acyl-CoA synthetase [Nematocida homosporus]|uniref:long-chain acyl-CoA synthetase n=1 Tax=Nematocida homosporus TaxID=1912981 RepID=UPI002220BC07|nr:long-chain acyl-CoA synthetase [Nematocida homosporus]KAI5186739.1 long-chain acyl-CoA synthetase [Nematocida homosporus]